MDQERKALRCGVVSSSCVWRLGASLSHWLRISFVNSFEFFGIVAAEECAPIIGNRLMAAVSALRGISGD